LSQLQVVKVSNNLFLQLAKLSPSPELMVCITLLIYMSVRFSTQILYTSCKIFNCIMYIVKCFHWAE